MSKISLEKLFRRGEKIKCTSCQFANECAYYGAAEPQEKEEDCCIIVQVDKNWLVINSPTYDGPKHRAFQSFKHKQDEDE